jgi:hypothetical protein
VLVALLHQVIAADPTPLSRGLNRPRAILGKLKLPAAATAALSDALRGGKMAAPRIVVLLLVILALTGCPGPNYAPYNNMRNSYG